MSRKESRRERKKKESSTNRASYRGGISRIYYIVIGVLFLILIGLVIFIFSRSGDDVALNQEDESAIVQDTEEPTITEENTEQTENTEAPDETAETAEESQSEEPESTEEEQNSEEEVEEEPETEETTDEQELSEGETATVSEDAPHDPDHAVDYNAGSSDRVAIKNQIMQATGLGSDLIEWWIGNNGPGRVVATVSDSSQSEYYEVYLQYGEGSWHVTSYQRVSGN